MRSKWPIVISTFSHEDLFANSLPWRNKIRRVKEKDSPNYDISSISVCAINFWVLLSLLVFSNVNNSTILELLTLCQRSLHIPTERSLTHYHYYFDDNTCKKQNYYEVSRPRSTYL